MTTKDIDKGYKRIISQLMALDGEAAIVGVFGGEYNADGVEIAEYAIDNEFGTEKIPSRPAFRISFDSNIDKINEENKHLIGDMISRKGGPRGLLAKVGENHKKRIFDTITKQQIYPTLHPITIAKKGHDKTLVDSGALAMSIKYKLVTTK